MTAPRPAHLDAGAGVNFGISKDILNALPAKERKRYQNRVAQRTYRRNQKQRVQALERLLEHASEKTLLTPVTPILADPALTPPDEATPALCIPPSELLVKSSQQQHQHQLQHQRNDSVSDNSEDDLDFSWEYLTNTNTGLKLSATRPVLHRAISNNNESMCRMLLQKGADASKQDFEGKTALHLAIETGSRSLVKLLLEQSDPNVKDGFGRTALFTAVELNNETMVRTLLESPIDVNSKDMLSEVALHTAVENGSEALTLLLLQSGADINA